MRSRLISSYVLLVAAVLAAILHCVYPIEGEKLGTRYEVKTPSSLAKIYTKKVEAKCDYSWKDTRTPLIIRYFNGNEVPLASIYCTQRVNSISSGDKDEEFCKCTEVALHAFTDESFEIGENGNKGIYYVKIPKDPELHFPGEDGAGKELKYIEKAFFKPRFECLPDSHSVYAVELCGRNMKTHEYIIREQTNDIDLSNYEHFAKNDISSYGLDYAVKYRHVRTIDSSESW